MHRTISRLTAATLLAVAVSGCGGGDGPTPPPQPTPTAAIALGAGTGSVTAGSSTTIPVTLTRGGGFTGDVALAVTGAPAGVTVAAQTIAAGATTTTLTVVTTAAAVAGTSTLTIAGVGAGVTVVSQSYALTVTAPASPIVQVGSDIQNAELYFGAALAVSADGSRVVVGARGETTNGTTRVFQRSGTTWTQVGGDIVGEGSVDRAGNSVDINAAGTRIAIGAYLNDNASFTNSGHVRVYDLVGTTWTQVGADIDGEGNSHQFGWRVALSASGSRVIAGSPGAGRARVFDLVGSTWTQVGGTRANSEARSTSRRTDRPSPLAQHQRMD
jgi:hypothetical protein